MVRYNMFKSNNVAYCSSNGRGKVLPFTAVQGIVRVLACRCGMAQYTNFFNMIHA